MSTTTVLLQSAGHSADLLRPETANCTPRSLLQQPSHIHFNDLAEEAYVYFDIRAAHCGFSRSVLDFLYSNSRNPPNIFSRTKRTNCRPDRAWDPPSLPYSGYVVSFLGVSRSGRGIDHPPQSSNEV